MKNNPFLSKEVSFKRIFKGLGIGLPVAIMLFVTGSYYVNLSEGYLRDKYKTEKVVYVEKDHVLGEEDTVDFSNSEDFQTDYTKWLYNEADRIVNTYDFSSKEIEHLTQIPEYKFATNKDIYEESYELSSKDIIGVNCSKLKSDFTLVYDVHYCDILLNSTEVLTAWSWTDNVKINPHITIFDNRDLKYPLIAVGEGFGYGSRDDLSVYTIIDGKLVNLEFNAKGENTETWYVDPYTKMYIEDGKEYLVTYFHDPMMVEKSLTRVWEVSDTDLKLVETILERGSLRCK